jgi:hypothetical protein
MICRRYLTAARCRHPFRAAGGRSAARELTMSYTPLPEDLHIYSWKNGGAPVLGDPFPVTTRCLQAMVGPTPVVYRVEDDRTYEWREPTKDERARVRAWLRRFIQQRGCSPVAN